MIGHSALDVWNTCVLVLVHLYVLVTAHNVTYVGNAEDDLVAEILSSLKDAGHMYSRPVSKAHSTLDVSLDISPIHILGFDEKNQVIKTMMWIGMSWTYDNIHWDPASYDGVTQIVLPPHLLWTPDIILYNRVESTAFAQESWIQVNSNGSAVWIPCMVYVSVCLVNMENFPYDVQTCPFKFGSWSFSESKLNLTVSSINGGLNRNQYTESMEWDLRDISVKRTAQKYVCCEDTFVHVEYEFVLARNSTFYTQFLILPVVLLGVVILAIFWIPPSRPDRTGLGMSLFASFMLLLLLVVQISPPSKTIKLITYCCINILLTATAMILSAIVVNISQYSKPLPWPIVKILRKKNRGPKFQSDSEEHKPVDLKTDHVISVKSDTSNKRDWVAFSLILDRVFFVVYLVVCVTTMAVYLPMPL